MTCIWQVAEPRPYFQDRRAPEGNGRQVLPPLCPWGLWWAAAGKFQSQRCLRRTQAQVGADFILFVPGKYFAGRLQANALKHTSEPVIHWYFNFPFFFNFTFFQFSLFSIFIFFNFHFFQFSFFFTFFSIFNFFFRFFSIFTCFYFIFPIFTFFFFFFFNFHFFFNLSGMSTFHYCINVH